MVLEHLSGKSGGFKTISNKYGIHHTMVERWGYKYELHGTKGLVMAFGVSECSKQEYEKEPAKYE